MKTIYSKEDRCRLWNISPDTTLALVVVALGFAVVALAWALRTL